MRPLTQNTVTRRSGWRVWASVTLGLLVAAALGGCNRGDPHQVAIEATSPATLAKWRMKMGDRFTPGEWKEFEAALQDVRLRVMADREASGSAAVEEAMCGRINGHTLREVLVMGYEARLTRLRPVREELKLAVEGNELLVTKPGDRASASYLENLRERQLERLRKTDAEITAAEQRIAALGGSAANMAATPAKAEAGGARRPEAKLTRGHALAEIQQLMRDQADVAVMKYGAWPMKIDRDGAALTGVDREDFVARRKAAAANGHTVVALRLRRWWIFDEKVEPPGFSKQVLETLTDVDRKEIAEEWAMVQAVTWARKTAFEEAAKEAEAAKAAEK